MTVQGYYVARSAIGSLIRQHVLLWASFGCFYLRVSDYVAKKNEEDVY